jgi:hypothetical protein
MVQQHPFGVWQVLHELHLPAGLDQMLQRILMADLLNRRNDLMVHKLAVGKSLEVSDVKRVTL